MKLQLHRTAQSGFTLVEILVAVSITTLCVLVLTGLIGVMQQQSAQQRAALEVEREMQHALHVMQSAIRTASSATSPAAQSDAAILSLTSVGMFNNANVDFTVMNGILYASVNGGVESALTTDRVVVSNFVAHDYSRTGTGGSIQVEFDAASSDAYYLPATYANHYYVTATLQ